jgi:transposase
MSRTFRFFLKLVEVYQNVRYNHIIEGKEGDMHMEALVKAIDPNFAYEGYEIEDGIMRLYVHSTRNEAVCPYCGAVSSSVHSIYFRKFRDLPIQSDKVEIMLKNRKFFCPNLECHHKTFAESFDCLPRMGRRSKRLTDTILNIAVNVSSVTASKTLKHGTADVGKSTICRLLKKERSNRGDDK